MYTELLTGRALRRAALADVASDDLLPLANRGGLLSDGATLTYGAARAGCGAAICAA